MRRLAIGLGALLAVLMLAGLWMSFGRTTDLSPAPLVVLQTPVASEGGQAPPPRRVEPEQPAPAVSPEVDAWITRNRALAAEALEYCALDELTMACEGEVCAFRMAYDRERQLQQRPLLGVEQMLVYGLGLPDVISPCARSANQLPPTARGWDAPRRYVEVRGDDPAMCYVTTAPGGHSAPGAGARLCTQLATQAGHEGGYL